MFPTAQTPNVYAGSIALLLLFPQEPPDLTLTFSNDQVFGLASFSNHQDREPRRVLRDSCKKNVPPEGTESHIKAPITKFGGGLENRCPTIGASGWKHFY
jgi:hypothetical protein